MGDTIREIATSCRWLAPTGHWLAHRAYGFLAAVAMSKKNDPAAILTCLDQRASFVRQAYPSIAPNYPPIPEHGWELLQAAELLLKADGWPPEWSDGDKRKAAAQNRLKECISVLEPLTPKDSSVIIAR